MFNDKVTVEKVWPERVWTAEELKVEFPETKSLRGILVKVTELIEEAGEVVCEVKVNGITLTEEEENKLAYCTSDEVLTLNIKSERPLKLLDESIVSCMEYIDRILPTFEKASLLFRTNDLKKAIDYHSKCVGASEVFVEMITHYKIAYESLRGGLPGSWSKLEDLMLASLTQILEAYSRKNYILVADLLEYDLSNIFSAWRCELEKLGSRKFEEST